MRDKRGMPDEGDVHIVSGGHAWQGACVAGGVRDGRGGDLRGRRDTFLSLIYFDGGGGGTWKCDIMSV